MDSGLATVAGQVGSDRAHQEIGRRVNEDGEQDRKVRQA